MLGAPLLLAAWLAGAVQLAEGLPRHPVPPRRPPAVDMAPQPDGEDMDDADGDEEDDEAEDDEDGGGAAIGRPLSIRPARSHVPAVSPALRT